MKKIKIIIMIIVMLICESNISLAHGGNITGWKDKDSKHITKYSEKYYGYHKKNGEIHFHQVKWNENSQKWEIMLSAVYYDENFIKIEPNYDENINKIEVELDSVVDGDTAKFIMDKEKITVRFLGINTKETVDPQIGEEAWGKEASDFTKEKLKNATKVELEFDEIADKKDKYNRYLAWIWVDNELLQDLLVKNGLAENYMLQYNYKYAGLLQESEEIAKNKKLVIWSNREIADRQNNQNQTSQRNIIDLENNKLIYIISIAIILIISIFNIAYKKKK